MDTVRNVGAVLPGHHDEWLAGRRYLGLDVPGRSRTSPIRNTHPGEVDEPRLHGSGCPVGAFGRNKTSDSDSVHRVASGPGIPASTISYATGPIACSVQHTVFGLSAHGGSVVQVRDGANGRVTADSAEADEVVARVRTATSARGGGATGAVGLAPA